MSTNTVAFVAGATGYTGRAVVQTLVASGVTAIAHVRPDSVQLDDWRARFGELGARVDATPWLAEAMAHTLADLRPTHVFALLGTTRRRAAAAARAGRAPSDYEAVDYGLSVLLLRAAAAASSRPRFVYLSALGAGGSGGNAYIQARNRVEAEVRASALPYLIVRPSFITGADREDPRPVERLAAAALDIGSRALALLGARRLRARLRPRTGEELARVMVRLALDERQGIVEAENL